MYFTDVTLDVFGVSFITRGDLVDLRDLMMELVVSIRNFTISREGCVVFEFTCESFEVS
jgi:hypothetical protein